MKINLSNGNQTDTKVRLSPVDNAIIDLSLATNTTVGKDNQDIVMCLSKKENGIDLTSTILNVTGPGVLKFVHDALTPDTNFPDVYSTVFIDDVEVNRLTDTQSDNTHYINVPAGDHVLAFKILNSKAVALRVYGDTFVPQNHTPTGLEPKVTEIVNYGDTVKTFSFVGHSQLTKVPAKLGKDVTSLYRAFAGCPNLNDPNISNWNTSKVTDGMLTFFNCISLNVPLYWDVSRFTTMYQFLDGATNYAQDLSHLCVGLIPSEEYGFSNGTKLTQAMKPKWGTCPSKVPVWEVLNGTINANSTQLTTSGNTIDLDAQGLILLTGAKVYLDNKTLSRAYLTSVPDKWNNKDFDMFIGVSNYDIGLEDWMNMTHDGTIYMMSDQANSRFQVYVIEDGEMNPSPALNYTYGRGDFNSDQDIAKNRAGFYFEGDRIKWSSNSLPEYNAPDGAYVYFMIKGKVQDTQHSIGLLAF